jgi:hypothetical protein
MANDEKHDAELAAWRAAFSSGQEPAAPAECPGDEALAALAIGELQGPERERAADHVVACQRCASDFRDLVLIHDEGRRIAAARARRTWAWGAAASLLLASGIAVLASRAGWLGPRGSAGEDVLRSGPGDAALGGVTPSPGARLDVAPAALAWKAQPGASSYRVRLFDARAELLWETEAATHRVELPDQARARLTAGGAYFWVVDPAGPARRRLGPHWFSLKARE